MSFKLPTSPLLRMAPRCVGRDSTARCLKPVRRALQEARYSDWSSKQYLRFQDERTQPARDLLAKVPLTDPKNIVDLGCGPGNSTELLIARYQSARVQGMDSSADMLRTARHSLPDVEFQQADLATYVPEQSVDLLFSNAVFHWLPQADRLKIMERLLRVLSPGGVLAIQVPDNYNEPSHSSMRLVAQEGPWKETLQRHRPEIPHFPSPSEIYNALSPLSSTIDIWHTRYNHVVQDHSAVVEWVKGSGLRPFLDPLSKEEQAKFVKKYFDLIRQEYKPLDDGQVMLAYPRLFTVAVRR